MHSVGFLSDKKGPRKSGIGIDSLYNLDPNALGAQPAGLGRINQRDLVVWEEDLPNFRACFVQKIKVHAL